MLSHGFGSLVEFLAAVSKNLDSNRFFVLCFLLLFLNKEEMCEPTSRTSGKGELFQRSG